MIHLILFYILDFRKDKEVRTIMNKKNIYFFIIFISFWTIIIILNFILPSEEFSENENRILAQMPKFKIEELITGKYVEKLNNYINDHFVFRNMWLKLKSTEERFLGKTENNNVYIGKEGYLFEKIKYTDSSKKKIQDLINTVNKFKSFLLKPFLLPPSGIYT